MLNALTVDVEEHFQVSGFADVVPPGAWDRHPSRVERNTERLLELFESASVQATFFFLGWVAERHPTLVERVAAAGHEVASHGFSHALVYEQSPQTFREETIRSRDLLQDASGRAVRGYRAASFSIGRGSLWALEQLADLGFNYDSSIFPVRHDRYGLPGAPRRIYRAALADGRSLIEVPPSTVTLGSFNLPIGGGGYLRLFPACLTDWAIRRLNRRESTPAVVYVHPWEVDTQQPRIRGRALSRARHYVNLATTQRKLSRLLRRHRFGPIEQVVRAAGELPQVRLT